LLSAVAPAAIGFLAQAAVILVSPVVRLVRLPELVSYPTSAY
jgi:hypothetical protein